MSRYGTRTIFRTKNSLYLKEMKERGLNYIRYYDTPKFKKLEAEDVRDIEKIAHLWSLGDRYYKLAHKYYGDAELWWIIAWFNLKPTEAHVNIGDIIQIPVPLWKIRSAYGV